MSLIFKFYMYNQTKQQENLAKLPFRIELPWQLYLTNTKWTITCYPINLGNLPKVKINYHEYSAGSTLKVAVVIEYL